MLLDKVFPDRLLSMSKSCPNSKTLCCQRNQVIFWNMTKPGVLYSKSSINAGCGRSCAVEPDKSSPLSLATAVKRLVAVCGTKCHWRTAVVFLTAISGMPTKKSFHRKHIMRLVKRVDRFRTWSVGIVHCANIRRAMSVKLFPFLSATPFITWWPNGLSLTTI